MQKLLIFFNIFLLFLFLFIVLFHPVIFDYDIGRHLLFGKLMVQNHSVIMTNLLSYTNTYFPYINSHWLSEVIFYLIFHFFGIAGLTIFAASITFFSLGLIFFFSARKTSLLFSSTILLINIYNITARIDVRPEIFSYLFLSIFVITLYRFREKCSKLIYILIPIEFLWVNLHINFLIGLVLIFIFLIDSFFSNKEKMSQKTKILFYVFILALMAALINPHGISGVLNPLNFPQNFSSPVGENQSIFALSNYYSLKILVPFCLPIIVLFVLLLLNKKRTRLVDWLIFIFFTTASFFAIRNVALFSYVTFFTSTVLLFETSAKINKLLRKYISSKHVNYLKIIVIVSIILVSIINILKINFTSNFGLGVTEHAKKGMDFFLKNGLKGPIYNDQDSGQYLSYRLYPKEKVFYDGRPEAYPKDFFKKVYSPMQFNEAVFNKYSQKYNFNTIITTTWNRTSRRTYFLDFLFKTDRSNFVLIYLDNYLAIFVKNTKENASLISKFSINKDSFVLEENLSVLDLVKYIYLFEKIGWIEQEEKAYQYLLKIDKNDCSLKNSLSLTNSAVTPLSIKPDLSKHCL